jgi:hypothetical protein
MKAGADILKKECIQAVFASLNGEISCQSTLIKAGFGQMGFLGLWRVFGWRVFSYYLKFGMRQ